MSPTRHLEFMVSILGLLMTSVNQINCFGTRLKCLNALTVVI